MSLSGHCGRFSRTQFVYLRRELRTHSRPEIYLHIVTCRSFPPTQSQQSELRLPWRCRGFCTTCVQPLSHPYQTHQWAVNCSSIAHPKSCPARFQVVCRRPSLPILPRTFQTSTPRRQRARPLPRHRELPWIRILWLVLVIDRSPNENTSLS